MLPGLVASDVSTRPLRSFLRHRGYKVSGWRQGRNLGLQPGVQEAMIDLVQELSDTHGRKVSLVGWSLGGLYARQLAKMMPDRVRSVITLGSPFAGHPKSTNAWRVYEFASGRRADEEDPRFGGSLSEPPPVPTTAIFSRTDGICAWQGCMEKPSAISESIEVESSHCGMGHHPAVVYAVADRLAQPEGAWAPFDRSGLRSWSSIPIRTGKPPDRLFDEPKEAVCLVACRFPAYRRPQARALTHRLDRHHGVRRCHRAARRLGLARTLLEFFAAIDIDSSVVRTAMSRLAADGWLERERIGRNSFYRLAEKGRQTFEAATRHIYDPPPSDWTGRFELLLIGNAEDRDSAREALRNAGFGSPLPGVWVAPSGVPVPEEAAQAIRLEVSAEDDSGRRLLSASWPLDRTAGAYLKFMATFAPLHDWLDRGETLSDIDAFTARILLIHHYRRVVLRDPLLPARCCRRIGRGGRRASSAATSIGRCCRRPSAGSTSTPSMRPGRCPQQVTGWRAVSVTSVRALICYRNILHDYYFCYILRSITFREAAHVHPGAQYVRGRRPQSRGCGPRRAVPGAHRCRGAHRAQ